MKYRDTWELDTIPDKPLLSEVARRNGLKGGRPKVTKFCPNCKKPFGAREMREHRCPARK